MEPPPDSHIAPKRARIETAGGPFLRVTRTDANRAKPQPVLGHPTGPLPPHQDLSPTRRALGRREPDLIATGGGTRADVSTLAQVTPMTAPVPVPESQRGAA